VGFQIIDNGKILSTGGTTALKIAYLDCFSGISGDMCLGALVDAGVSLKQLLGELEKIPLKGYEIRVRKVKRAGISATKADVIIEAKSKELRTESDPTHPPLGCESYRLSKGRSNEGLLIKKLRSEGEEQGAKRWEDIERIIHKSSLSKAIKEKGLRVFRRLFAAEAKIHGEGFRKVHLHELGAVDCLIDIFGAIIGFDILGVEKIYSSPVNLGSGFVKTKHGILPVPSPASAETLKGVPVYSTDSNFELTTPTGAALVRELSSGFGDLPLMDIETIGLGAGNRNFKDRPNVLRLFVGNPAKSPHTPLWQRGARGDLKGGLVNLSDEVATVIEANIDDMNPQIYEYVIKLLFKKGALDVFLTQVIMKKGRPGIKLTVLCKEKDREELIKIIFMETTTIGLRFYDVQRRVLRREVKTIETEFGKVRVKFSRLGKEILKATPEYEDCKRLARKLNVPLIEIMRRIKIPSSK
jgi:uncharacterized protein (TIGR00299 family) protein